MVLRTDDQESKGRKTVCGTYWLQGGGCSQLNLNYLLLNRGVYANTTDTHTHTHLPNIASNIGEQIGKLKKMVRVNSPNQRTLLAANQKALEVVRLALSAARFRTWWLQLLPFSDEGRPL